MAEKSKSAAVVEEQQSDLEIKTVEPAGFKPAEPGAVMPGPATPPVSSNRSKRLLQRYWAKKKLTIPLTVLAICLTVLAIPVSRYQVLGLFIQKDFKVRVVDMASGKPVSKAQVKLGGSSTQTDAQGNVTLRGPVGSASLQVTKKYYKTMNASVTVGLEQKNAPFTVFISATGRQVPVSVTNKITGKPIAGALLAAAGSEAKTGTDGTAVLVVPADKPAVDIAISLSGFNSVKGSLQVTEQLVDQNNFKLLSSGKIYFLSKLSGKIDVVKTNLDGSDRQTVLAGTGKEDNADTIMLASRDWNYLVLKSKRDGGDNAKLFLINAGTSKVTTIDEGKADFGAIGWSGHNFIYRVDRDGYKIWQPKAHALKAYDATTDKLTTLDETDAEGSDANEYKYNLYGTPYLMGDEVVFFKRWYSVSNRYYDAPYLNGKQITLTSIRSDGTAKKTIKEFPIPDGQNYSYFETRLYEPNGLIVQVPDYKGANSYYEYEDGKISAKPDISDKYFNDEYPTYLLSPSGSRNLWSEARDGKNTLFVGDSNGASGKEIAPLSEYKPYGWYSDNYVLVTKDGSELYIMPASGGTAIKIADYHKPDSDYRGYGGGYGGL